MHQQQWRDKQTENSIIFTRGSSRGVRKKPIESQQTAIMEIFKKRTVWKFFCLTPSFPQKQPRLPSALPEPLWETRFLTKRKNTDKYPLLGIIARFSMCRTDVLRSDLSFPSVTLSC